MNTDKETEKKIDDFIKKAEEKKLFSIDELFKMVQAGDIDSDTAAAITRYLQVESIRHDPNDTLYKADKQLYYFYEEEINGTMPDFEAIVNGEDDKKSDSDISDLKKDCGSFVICEDDGGETKCEILFTFYNKKTDKDYMAYTDNTLDSDGNTKVYAATYNPEENNPVLVPIETDEEWSLLEEILDELYG